MTSKKQYKKPEIYVEKIEDDLMLESSIIVEIENEVIIDEDDLGDFELN